MQASVMMTSKAYTDLDEECSMKELQVTAPQPSAGPLPAAQRQRSSTSTDTDMMIQQFRTQREEKKHKSFWYVIKLSWALMLSGMVGYMFDSAMLYLVSDVYPTFMSTIMSSLSMFVVGCGYLLFSTVPLDSLDIDEAVSRKYWMRVLFMLVGFSISVVFTLVPPFIHGISSVIAISTLYPDNKDSPYWNRFTFKVSIWFLSYAFCLSVVYAYWCYVSYYDIDMDNQGIIALNVPIGEGYFVMYVALTVYYGLAALLFMRIWYTRRQLYITSNHEKGAGPTMSIFLCMYCWNFFFGVGLFINGIWLYVIYLDQGDNDHGVLYFSTACIGVGVALLVPPVVVYTFTREAIFNIMAKRFDTNSKNLQRDGAFIAGLLDKVDIVVGQSWYIHRDTHDPSFDELDCNRFWVKGRVTAISADNTRMAVSHTSPVDNKEVGEPIWLNLGVTTDSNELLDLARKNLRCVDFETIIAKDLLTNGSVRAEGEASFYDLGRSVAPGEKIDFFISHSWHDCAEVKVEKLKMFGEKFRKKYNRYPTFWLDKVCIDQNNIGSGLKVLPINVMACKQMLMLCGKTYSRRLWCVWEICTLFSFVDIEAAFDKVAVLPLDRDNDDKSGGVTSTSVMKELMDFHISKAHCYDPNEEIKLNTVISAVGMDKFHDKIRKLATFYVEEGRDRSMTV